MKVYVFDLLAYGKHFDEFKAEKLLPYPLSGQYFDPDVAARTYDEHIAAWKEMDKLGFDGVGLNEHHTTAHSLMNSPNMMAAVGAQHTKSLKFLTLGNLLPIHNPLRVAEEIAMADCMSKGRMLPGFARGLPREYRAFNVPISESRARFEEAFEVIYKAWTEDVFSHKGKFWQYENVAIWPRPFQEPHPPLWVPFTGSKETIEWAAKRNFNVALPAASPGLTEDIVGYYAKNLAANGFRLNSDQICLFTDCYVADSKDAAIREYADCYLYFAQTLWHHGSLRAPGAPPPPVATGSHDYIRPENRGAAELDREKIRKITYADMETRVRANQLAWGSPDEVATHLIRIADHAGANSLALNMNLGALPQELFIEQIRRFGREVLPRLHAHQVTRFPAAAAVA
jgi:alkanesulfonate monooxygenase SsuD/methylene tetrahydromethanopterin reductase-like flavin-dependent oxidoreductase (luciferase family)